MNPAPPSRTIVFRGAAFGLAWVAMAGTAPADLAIGLVAAGLATWASLTLIPPRAHPVGVGAALRLALRFPGQSLRAGIDVARRAFDPALPLAPGVVAIPTGLAPGTARDGFCALLSLQPGTLPLGGEGATTLRLHCLDTHQPIAAAVAAEEALYRAACNDGTRRG
ncbi:Na+/H+ antiporter subunit E [Ancylobacter terrae]|uniref:Na+/H+ antiporter subunit E n=1 Tax=Ancylobacter sp. sgz301288 TaxID=3342077 RepID=UPI00385C903D